VQFFFQGTKVGEEERTDDLGMEDGARITCINFKSFSLIIVAS
jgi:hypothetical protein